MPELPEVETIRRQLQGAVEGAVIDELRIDDPRWCAPLAPERVSEALVGREVLRLRRRGKYLVWECEGEVSLLVHLRMTGTLLLDPPAPLAHSRVLLTLSARAGQERRTIAFVDPRRFGTGQLALSRAELDEFFASRLGLEPLEPGFGGAHLYALSRGRRAPIKAFLLDQRRVAGVGNIYADEALHRARIHPLAPAGRLTRSQHEALSQAVVATLEAGIDARGATIDDFRHVDGVRGSFQDQFLVHRRAGHPCTRCGQTVVKLVVAGRGTYVCPECQPAPRARRPRGAPRVDRRVD